MLPVETILAIFPRGAEVRGAGDSPALRLHPLTLAHAAAMEAFGCNLGEALDDAHALIAAWLLSKEPGEMPAVIGDMGRYGRDRARWLRARVRHVARLANAVNASIFASFKTFVEPKGEEGEVRCGPTGLGWPLEIAECLCGEYGWSFAEALATPVATAFALVSAARQRHGGENGGPDYYERIMAREINALEEAKAQGERAKEAQDGGGRE